jgi:hypothetical protein
METLPFENTNGEPKSRYDIARWRTEQLTLKQEAERIEARKILGDYTPPEFGLVLLADLRIDDGYQRTLNQNKVHKLRARFLPNACQPLSVSHRTKAGLYLVDGQHRAKVLLDIGVTGWAALIYHKLSRRDEAAMWQDLNMGQTKARTADGFKAGLMKREPEAVAIQGIVQGAGLKLTFKGGGAGAEAGTQVRAIEALQQIYRTWKGPGLADVLNLLQKVWPQDEGARTSRYILLGLAAFLGGRWKRPIQMERAAKQLAAATPTQFLAKARGSVGGAPVEILCREFARYYNRGTPRDARL